MLTILALLAAALGCALLAVATIRRPRIAAPSAAAAAGLLLVIAARLAGMEGVRWPYPVTVIACALVCVAWAWAVAVGDADRRRDAEEARQLTAARLEAADRAAGGAR